MYFWIWCGIFACRHTASTDSGYWRYPSSRTHLSDLWWEHLESSLGAVHVTQSTRLWKDHIFLVYYCPNSQHHLKREFGNRPGNACVLHLSWILSKNDRKSIAFYIISKNIHSWLFRTIGYRQLRVKQLNLMKQFRAKPCSESWNGVMRLICLFGEGSSHLKHTCQQHFITTVLFDFNGQLTTITPVNQWKGWWNTRLNLERLT